MLREIYEQPEALAATMAHYAPGGMLDTNIFGPVAEALRGRQRVVIAASGSSRHAGLAGEIMLEDNAGLAVDVEYSSEYMYRSTHTLHDPGVLVISQSGETADTLASLREAKARGASDDGGTGSRRSSDEKFYDPADGAVPIVAVSGAYRRTDDSTNGQHTLRAIRAFT
jgi:glucosamine--fructose-6-phosphate aminotransferase (isomerizing)